MKGLLKGRSMDKDEGHWQLRDRAGNGMRRKVGKSKQIKDLIM